MTMTCSNGVSVRGPVHRWDTITDGLGQGLKRGVFKGGEAGRGDPAFHGAQLIQLARCSRTYSIGLGGVRVRNDGEESILHIFAAQTVRSTEFKRTGVVGSVVRKVPRSYLDALLNYNSDC